MFNFFTFRLHSRNLCDNLEYFVLNQMNDSVVGRAAHSDLFALGLVSGQIIAFRQFSGSGSGIKSYKKRVGELQGKIKNTHSGKADKSNRPSICQRVL